MAHSVFFLGEYSVISEIWSTLHISELIRSPISYAIPYFVTANDKIIVTDTASSLSADLLFLEMNQIANDDDPWCTFLNIFIIITVDQRDPSLKLNISRHISLSLT